VNNKNLLYIILALIIGVSLIISSFFISQGLINLKSNQNTITVTGSSKKQIKSDLVKWTGTFSAQSSDLKEAYKTLKESYNKVKQYLLSKGLKESDLLFSSIYTTINYEILPNGNPSSNIESYKLEQSVMITSKDVDRISRIARESTELINQGIQFQSLSPEYYYTKIANLKIDMLGLATKDAKERAEQIAKSTGIKIGNLKSAKMGVFQITAPYSTDISDYGAYDTSSIEKEITAVINCTFEIK